jgi:hypothetical protein
MTSNDMNPPGPDVDRYNEPRSSVEAVPDEEDVDSARVEEDLEKSPAEKENATDGYAPADDKAVDTAEMDELED